MNDWMKVADDLILDAVQRMDRGDPFSLEIKKMAESVIRSNSIVKKKLILGDFSEWILDYHPDLSDRMRLHLADLERDI